MGGIWRTPPPPPHPHPPHPQGQTPTPPSQTQKTFPSCPPPPPSSGGPRFGRHVRTLPPNARVGASKKSRMFFTEIFDRPGPRRWRRRAAFGQARGRGLSPRRSPVTGGRGCRARRPGPLRRRLAFRVQLMQNCKFVFAPRGLGLHSFRLLEILAAGAVPVFIADAAALPFEHKIEWSKFSFHVQVLRVAARGGHGGPAGATGGVCGALRSRASALLFGFGRFARPRGSSKVPHFSRRPIRQN